MNVLRTIKEALIIAIAAILLLPGLGRAATQEGPTGDLPLKFTRNVDVSDVLPAREVASTNITLPVRLTPEAEEYGEDGIPEVVVEARSDEEPIPSLLVVPIAILALGATGFSVVLVPLF